MKSNKGVTLISLTIYIILFTVIIGILSTITGYFMKNLDEISVSENSEELFGKFLAFINNDINNKNLFYIKAGQDLDENGISKRDYIVFKFTNGTEHQYIVEKEENDNTLYFLNIINADDINNRNYDKIITLCKNVTEDEIFKYADNKLNISMKINGKPFSTDLNTNLSN